MREGRGDSGEKNLHMTEDSYRLHRLRYHLTVITLSALQVGYLDTLRFGVHGVGMGGPNFRRLIDKFSITGMQGAVIGIAGIARTSIQVRLPRDPVKRGSTVIPFDTGDPSCPFKLAA